MGGSGPQMGSYYPGAKQSNLAAIDYYKKLIADKAKQQEETSRLASIPSKLPTDDEWHYLTEDAKRKWKDVTSTDYTQPGNIYPGMKKVMKINPDIEATRSYLNYAPPGERGKWVQVRAAENNGYFQGWEDYSKLPQVGGNIDQYYTAQAFSHGADPWMSEWQFDENNPLYKALWQKNSYRDDFFDTQALGQQEDILSGQLAAYNRQLMPDYGYNFNTAKVAQAGGK